MLLFLHADTRLPAGYGSLVREALRTPAVALAAFRLSLAPRNLRGLSLVEWGANRRSRVHSLPYGDQALCCRREVFECLGGFPDLPLLEDVELVCAARAIGEVRILPDRVVSSSRRWAKFGVVGNTMLNQCVLLGRELGVPAATMARWYYGAAGKKDY